MKLQINEHPIDRAVRVVLGIALLAAGAAGLVVVTVMGDSELSLDRVGSGTG
jgi:hypothetical protein